MFSFDYGENCALPASGDLSKENENAKVNGNTPADERTKGS